MMMRQTVTYIMAPHTYKAFVSADPEFGEAFENSDLGKHIETSMTSIKIKIKILKQKVSESWKIHVIWHYAQGGSYTFEEKDI